MPASEGLRQRKRRRTAEAIVDAAHVLFLERGFDEVTMAQVAQRVDVSERTVFRYFPDKQELLFADDGAARARLADAVAAQPADALPVRVAADSVAALCELWEGRRDDGRRRQHVIDSSVALQARARAKQVDYEQVLVDGLVERGLSTGHARLLARTSVGCFDEAVLTWLADDEDGPTLRSQVEAAFGVLADLLSGGQGD